MSRTVILNSNSQGMVRDLEATTLLLEQWTWVEGVRVADGKLSRFGGPEAVGLTISISPTAIFEYRHGTRPNALIFVDNESAWLTEGEALVDITQVAQAPYQALPNEWTYVNFNGLVVLNNYRKVPQAGETIPITQLVDLSNWPATWRAHAIRAYKTLLIALNLTIAGDEQPHQFAHSDIIESPFIPPPNWNVADPESVAGLNLLTDTEGPLVDGLQLRELFVIYKDRQAYVLTLGGNNVFNVVRSFPKGLIAMNCICEISLPEGPRHFCVGQEDIYLSTGYAEQSISDGRLSKWFYANITSGLESHVHVRHHQARREVWIMFPYGTAATACNYALIYNYLRPAFYLFPLPAGTTTVEPSLFNAADDLSGIWSDALAAWETRDDRWVAFPSTFSTGRLISAASNVLYFLDQDMETTDVAVILERTGLAITGQDYRGNPTYDPNIYKLINDFWPRFAGAGEVRLEVPVQELPDGAITYQGPWDFTVGDRRTPPMYAQGYLIGLRVTNLDTSVWTMIGYDLDIQQAGA